MEDIELWIILGVFGIVTLIVIIQDNNRFEKRFISSLSQNLDTSFLKTNYFWQSIALQGKMEGLWVKIYFGSRPGVERNEITIRVTLNRRIWDLKVSRATIISIEQSDIKTQDKVVDKHYLIKSKNAKIARNFMQNPVIAKALHEFVPDFKLNDEIEFKRQHIYFYTSSANITSQKKQRFLNVVTMMVFLAKQLNESEY